MIITEIKIQKGHLYEIFTDEAPPFFLDRDFFDETGLKKGGELSTEKIRELLEESDYIRAKSRALWFLDRADRSEKVLLQKIVSGGISKDAALRAIERLKELGLVDNLRFAQNTAQYYLSKNLSRRQVYAKLIEKGVPSSLANEVLKETAVDEAAQISALIERKYKAKLDTRENRAKVIAALMRRGFNYENIKAALKDYRLEAEDFD